MSDMRKTNAKPEGGAARLPALDLLRGFESAARQLSFTEAGRELHLSQSAISRQIKDLEDQLGTRLFERRYRALALTEAGRAFYGTAAQAIAVVREGVERLRSLTGRRVVSVATTPAFAALWLIPRLASFARQNPGLDVRVAAEARVQDLAREQVDVAVRYCPAAMVGEGAERLFGEQVIPVCSPALLADPKRPLRTAADLARHTLLHLDDPDVRYPWASWRVWLEVAGEGDLRGAGNLSFTQYGDVIAAALAGQGVAIGRSPLVDRALARGDLVAPLGRSAETQRSYWLITSGASAARTEVQRFARWMHDEARGCSDPAPSGAARARRRPRKKT